MIPVPTNERELLAFSNELVDQCRVSVSMRTAYCRLMNSIAETGRYDGSKSLINLLYKHLTRTAAHLFSPVELKFAIDFENKYPKNIVDRAAVVGKILTRSWERNNTDMLFGRGVFESLKYGASILKQWVQVEGAKETPVYYAKLIMPWQFGVYNEAENDISRQEALCETTPMTLPEVWRRIYHLPNASKLYDKIKSHARTGSAMSEPQSYFHQVLSTSQLNTGVQQNTSPLPGGIVQLGNNPNYAIMGPQVMAPVVDVHELWVKGENDWKTIIKIEPDILVTRFKTTNLLGVDGLQPYRLIQPNETTNWFWGRSELVDLIEPQELLSVWADDIKRLFGLQIDKILAFVGEGGVTDELYAQFRGAGWMNLQQGSDVKDLTPKMPPESMAMLKFLIDEIDRLAGFPNIMRGEGESGVRAGNHATTMMKTASPTLRDRALLVERQLAIAADLTLAIKEAKDAQTYWTKADTLDDVAKTSFQLTDLPEDWRVTVDSHSSSPIFSDENTQLIMAAHARQIVQSEYVIDQLSFPAKEEAKAQNKQAAENKAKEMQMLMQTNPELAEKIMAKQMGAGGGGKR